MIKYLCLLICAHIFTGFCFQSIDTLYFTGMNKDGVYLITHLGRRSGRRAEVWLSLLLPDDRFYQLPIHPATTVYNVGDNSYSAAGLKMECLEPMKRWKISYNGLLRQVSESSAKFIGHSVVKL